MCFTASSCLHTSSGHETGQAVGGDAISIVGLRVGAAHHSPAVWVLARQVEQVNTSEDGEETTKQRDGVDGVGSVESFEKNKRGDQGEGREGDIVERIDTVCT